TSERMAADTAADVLWLNGRDASRGGPQLCVAPLQVWAQMRDKLLTEKTVVFTSATLMLGGNFDSVAGSLGLKPSERAADDLPQPTDPPSGPLPLRRIAVDPPFDLRKQAISYAARHLPPPGRDGLCKAHHDEIVVLVDAADGRALV